MSRGDDVLAALKTQPGGPQLQMLTLARDDAALVGGAVRDLLLSRTPRELDVVVADDAAGLARELAAMLGANTIEHKRFGTAAVQWEEGRIDIAERRAESYPAPGALPEVRPGSIADDLQRRDFTVNAIAVRLGGAHRGELDRAEHALEDLAAGRLRVLHDLSFIDDPTRLLRLARYRARLGFQVDAHTARLAAQAIAQGALATVSSARIGAELRLALCERDPLVVLSALDELGVWPALGPHVSLDEALAQRALALLPYDGRTDLLLMAALLLDHAVGADAQPTIHALLDGLEFTAGERDRVLASALHARALASELTRAERPSALHRALAAHTLEAVALGGALASAPREDGAAAQDGADELPSADAAAREWLQELRHVRLAITGEDLLAAGVPEGPEIDRRLDAALARKLDGALAGGRDAELNAALEASA